MRIIAGRFKNRPLATPKGLIVRPTAGKMRAALFNICQNYIQDADFLDLFAGSGAIGLEALSRGAKHVTFVDISRESIRCVQANVEALEAQKEVEILYGDVFARVQELMDAGRRYDIIYSDPPYDRMSHTKGELMSYNAKLLQMLDEGQLLKSGGELFLEDSGDSAPPLSGLKTLKLKSERHMGRSALHQFENLIDFNN